MNVGSSEVKAVASALQNRIISDLINSALIRPLSKVSGKADQGANFDSMSKNITANDLLPILVAITNGRYHALLTLLFSLSILELFHTAMN